MCTPAGERRIILLSTTVVLCLRTNTGTAGLLCYGLLSACVRVSRRVVLPFGVTGEPLARLKSAARAQLARAHKLAGVSHGHHTV